MGQKQERGISEETAQKLAIRAWVGTRFPKAHGIDEDEEPDQVQLAGSSVVVFAEIYTGEWPTQCPGMMCWLPSDACDTCIHGGAKPEKARARQMMPNMEDVRILLKKYGNYAHNPYPPLEPVFQSRHEMKNELFSTAPMSRGGRARASGQMRF